MDLCLIFKTHSTNTMMITSSSKRKSGKIMAIAITEPAESLEEVDWVSIGGGDVSGTTVGRLEVSLHDVCKYVSVCNTRYLVWRQIKIWPCSNSYIGINLLDQSCIQEFWLIGFYHWSEHVAYSSALWLWVWWSNHTHILHHQPKKMLVVAFAWSATPFVKSTTADGCRNAGLNPININFDS